MPEVFGLPEEGPEADGHGRSDRSTAEHNLIDSTGRDAYGPRHGILRNAHREKVFLEKNLAWSDWSFHSAIMYGVICERQ